MSEQDISQIAHLMRRAGFGAPLEELQARAAKGYDATVEELLDPESQPPMERDVMMRYKVDWLSQAGHGVFTHYLSSLQNDFGRNSQGKNSSWDEAVDAFDAKAYAASAAETPGTTEHARREIENRLFAQRLRQERERAEAY